MFDRLFDRVFCPFCQITRICSCNSSILLLLMFLHSPFEVFSPSFGGATSAKASHAQGAQGSLLCACSHVTTCLANAYSHIAVRSVTRFGFADLFRNEAGGDGATIATWAVWVPQFYAISHHSINGIIRFIIEFNRCQQWLPLTSLDYWFIEE